MLQFLKKNYKILSIGLLLFFNITIWIFVFAEKPRSFVEVSFLDVGQGDSILIEARNGNQVLFDSGPNRKVLSELSKELPFFDRSIDILVATHPDTDHIGGFPEIVKRYKTRLFVEPGIGSETSLYKELKNRLKAERVSVLEAKKGMVIDLKDGSFIEVFFPDRDISGLDPNDASIIARYVFGEVCFLLTGDASQKMEEYVLSLEKEDLNCDVLKVGHHGSKTSTSPAFVSAVSPSVAIISAGKDNRYGHPHEEVLETLEKAGIEILSTAQMGTIRMRTDGKNLNK